MWINDKKSILALAPLADITDGPFCQTCRQFIGRDFIIFREMVSSEAIVRGNAKTLKMCRFEDIERPIVAQIFGADPDAMAMAARIIMDEFGPDGIDINMGCPVPKVTGKAGAGAALLKDAKKAVAIVSAVREAVPSVPVSVKTRLGWTDPRDILQFAPKMEKAGANLITIHGRTRAQGYAGRADWQAIREAKKLVSIPLLANGDVISPETYKECMETTRADGVMIGRGAIGNPWIFQQIQCLETRPPNIGLEMQKEFVLAHARRHVERYGERGILAFRKYFGYYFKGTPGAKEIRRKLVRVKSIREIQSLLRGLE